MKVEETELPGVLVIEPEVFADERGHFLEIYRSDRYRALGLPDLSAQDNVSFSRRGVLRGLHLQHPRGQAKLCHVLQGEVFDVAVDLRRSSSHFGKWMGLRLSAEGHRQLFVPAGFAHGFCVLSETALFSYRCSEPYVREQELAIRWNDPQLAIRWPVREPLLSPRDATAPLLAEIAPETLPG